MRSAASKASTSRLNSMFDAEVLAELRRQFTSADKDGNGTLDMEEACQLVASSGSSPGDSEDSIRRTAAGLMNQMDANRSASISFEEYCFRFGRKYQMEAARRRRNGEQPTSISPPGPSDDAARKLEQEREVLRKEREALEREREEIKRAREADGARLAAGTRVTIRGLQGTPELNGRFAKVVRFEDAQGRYVVELENGCGARSLKPDNLVACREGGVDAPHSAASSSFQSASAAAGRYDAVGPSLFERAKDAFQKLRFRVQVWLAGYEWWQLALMIGILVLVVNAYLQNRARFAGARSATDGRNYAEEGPRSRTGSEGSGERYGSADDGYRNSRRGGEGYRSGGLFAWMDKTTTMLVAVGFGFLCWKGIIPVHRMSFFQLIILWQIVEPLFAGRRPGRGYYFGMGYPFFGMGRRGFFF